MVTNTTPKKVVQYYLSEKATTPMFEGQQIKKIKSTKAQHQYLLEHPNCYIYKAPHSDISLIVENRMTITGRSHIMVYILDRENANEKGKRLKDALYIVFTGKAINDFFSKCKGAWQQIEPLSKKTYAASANDVINYFIDEAEAAEAA